MSSDLGKVTRARLDQTSVLLTNYPGNVGVDPSSGSN
jgi:hypothetical protein